MYRVQIEVAKHQSGRIHLERESYTKAEGCRLFSGTKRLVATIEADIASRRRTQRTRAQADRQPTSGQWDLVCAVVRGMQHNIHQRFQEWQRSGVFEQLGGSLSSFMNDGEVLSGLGKLSIASRVQRHWAAHRRVKVQWTVPGVAAKSISWSMTVERP